MPRTPAFQLPDFLPATLASALRVLSLNKGEILFRQGEAVTCLVYVLTGEMKAVRAHLDGAECVMVRSKAGEFFAESALASPAYVCDGIAVCPSRIALMPVDALRQALREDGEFALAFAMALAKQARKQCSRYERVRLKRARDRVLHYLACEGGSTGCVDLASSLAELAGELALEPETLYRTVAELEAEGRVARDSRKLTLLPAPEEIPPQR
jgi:CRP/FNR family transcriptional regulator, dissimilatory nitrate respiration regulator